MNKIFIVGNVTKDPELRTTTTGKNVCTFTVAVNRRKPNQNGEHEADFFRVSTWEGMADNCAKYLSKGKKVSVVGAVSVHSYTTQKGEAAANMEVLASEVEFLSPKQDDIDSQTGYKKVDPSDLPY